MAYWKVVESRRFEHSRTIILEPQDPKPGMPCRITIEGLPPVDFVPADRPTWPEPGSGVVSLIFKAAWECEAELT